MILPDVPGYLQHFRSDNPTVDYLFKIYAQLPVIPLHERVIHFSGGFWSMFLYQQKRWFEAQLGENGAQQVFVSLDPDQSQGEIYYQAEHPNGSFYPFDLRLLKLILVDLFSKRDGIFVHASGIMVENQVILFAGSSEAGKSTTARLWKAVPDAEIISDERVLLTRKGGEIWAYGTPWQSSERSSSPHGAPLKGIFLINHGSTNLASPLPLTISLPRLLTHTMLAYWDKQELSANLDFAKEVLSAVPCYQFGFVPDASAVEYIQCLLR